MVDMRLIILPTVLRNSVTVSCYSLYHKLFFLSCKLLLLCVLISMLMYVDLISLISTDVCLLLNLGDVCLYFTSILIISLINFYHGLIFMLCYKY